MRLKENSICIIRGEGGFVYATQSDIEQAAYHHYKALFSERELSFSDQMDFINHMPSMLEEPENDILGRPVTIE